MIDQESLRDRTLRHCARLDCRRVWAYGLALGMMVEMITAVMRFGVGMRSTDDTAWLATFTFGLRIHHGYLGLAAVLMGWLLCKRWRAVRNLLFVLGIGLVFSDFVHHFLVLWPITGSPEFDLVYP